MNFKVPGKIGEYIIYKIYKCVSEVGNLISSGCELQTTRPHQKKTGLWTPKTWKVSKLIVSSEGFQSIVFFFFWGGGADYSM